MGLPPTPVRLTEEKNMLQKAEKRENRVKTGPKEKKYAVRAPEKGEIRVNATRNRSIGQSY